MNISLARFIKYRQNIPAFAKAVLNFELDPVQSNLLAINPSRCILNCSRQWGKSTITAIKALHHALLKPGSLTLVISPSERQSAEFINKVTDLALLADLKPAGDGKNNISLRFPNRSRIIGLPPKDDTTRGFSAPSLILIDEAARVPDQLYRSVRPMLAVSRGDLWLISTPNGRRGFFYQTWSSPDPEWTRLSVPATECPRISHPFLQKERLELGERNYRQEYLCEFHDQDGQLLSREYIDQAVSPHVKPLPIAPRNAVSPRPNCTRVSVLPQPPSPPLPDLCLRSKLYLAIDFGQAADYTAIAILEKSWWHTGPRNHWNYEREREERFAVRHLERFPLNTPYREVVARIGRIVRSMDPNTEYSLSADATGVGRPLIEYIRNLRIGKVLSPVVITSGMDESYDGSTYKVPKRLLLNGLVLQFESGLFKISSDLDLANTLLEELAGLRVKISNAGNEIISPWRDSQHDDLVFAVALANWQALKDHWYEPQGRLF